MIETRGLEKRFGRQRALVDLDLVIPTGAITAVAGPNASGKTTLIKAILGLVKPDSGDVLLDGRSLLGDWRFRERIGYMPQNARLPVNLSATEVFQFLAELRGRNRRVTQRLVDTFRLGDEADKPIRTLSGGTRQKVNAVTALMFDPEILILDEPTAGLDPVSSRLMKDRIRLEREAGKTVLLTSHIISDLEELADRIVLLIDGAVRFAGSPTEIREQSGDRTIEGAFARIMAEEDRG